jgi:hypothetical protein
MIGAKVETFEGSSWVWIRVDGRAVSGLYPLLRTEFTDKKIKPDFGDRVVVTEQGDPGWPVYRLVGLEL